MNGEKSNQTGAGAGPLSCVACQDGLQEYLEGTLGKARSLRFFIHLRGCGACEKERLQLQQMFALLDDLPVHEVPADFDETILASVPYASYRAMERLRRERVPVYLEERFLPAYLRSRVTRWSGLGMTAAAMVGAAVLGNGPSWLVAGVVGLLPELLVQGQRWGRRAAIAQKAGN